MPRVRRPIARVSSYLLHPKGTCFAVEICEGGKDFGEEVTTYPSRETARQHAKLINDAIRWRPGDAVNPHAHRRKRPSVAKVAKQYDGDPNTRVE